jgi:putative polyketide hydroxylase
MTTNHVTTLPSTTDVLVVGGGPAGLTTAITLARNGVDVLIVERHTGTSPFPKATGISVRTMELFRTWGVESRVRDGAMLVQPYTAISETLAGPRLDAIPFGYPTDEAARAISPTTSCYCPQDHLEPVLVDHLRAVGGRIRFGTGLTHFDLDGDAVTAQLRDNATGHTWQIRTRYLVGADGPRSGVRSRLGIGIDEFGTLGRFIAATFRADLTRHLPQVPAAINAVQVAGAEGLLVPTSGDDRWIYARQCDVDEDSVLNWPSQRWVEVLRAATGVADLEPTVEQVLPFEMAGHVATAFRRGRAFIVGDAVHRTTPVGGIGSNTAIQSAHNLGWKLAWVLRGLAGDALLDSYESERRPVATSSVLRSLRRGPQPSAEGIAEDLGIRYGEVERAPHAWVHLGGGRVSTLDLFDARLTLLTGPNGGAWRQSAIAMAGAGLPLTALSTGQELDDPAGALSGAYTLGDADAVLVRPDGYIACRLPASETPGADLLEAVTATLARPGAAALQRVS